MTVEELDARHAKKRAELLAKQEAAAKAKLEREAGKAGKNKFEALKRFLERSELSLFASGDVIVLFGGERIGVIDGTGGPE